MDIISILPRSLRSWACVIVLLCFLFVSYYLYMFPILHDFYSERERGYPALYSSSFERERCRPLEVHVDSPRQIASFDKRWVYLTLTNTISKPITVTASLSTTHSVGWYMPFLFRSSNIEALSFSPLYPYATAHERIPLFSSNAISLSINIVYILGDQIQECSISIAQPPEYNPKRALVHSFIEQLLLPPWSNWILAAIGLIIPPLVESREQKQNRSVSPWWQSLCRMFLISLALSLTIVAWTLLMLSAIWWPKKEGSGGMWNTIINTIIIVTGFLMFLIFIWRTLDLDLPSGVRDRLQNIIARLNQKEKRIIAILVVIAWLLLLWCTHFPLLKALWGISLIAALIAGALEILKIMKEGANESGTNNQYSAVTCRDKSQP